MSSENNGLQDDVILPLNEEFVVDYGVIAERGSLDGVPISIGGRSQIPHVVLQDGDKTYSRIDLKRELAIELNDAKLRYRKTVRLHGVGRWHRDAEGDWELKGFRAEGFDILGDAPLGEVVEKLRSVPGSGWDDIDNPDSFLRDLRKRVG